MARLQISRKMRLPDAKTCVAERLGVSAAELSDPLVMEEVRGDHGLGRVTTFETLYPTQSSAIEAKFNISRLLDLPINCVERFRERAGLG